MSIKPDWNEIAQRIGDDLSHDDLHSEWSKECKKWLESIANEFGSDYRIEESLNFSIMSNESDRYIHVFSGFLERTLKRILNTLDGIASDQGFGKHVALIFQDIDQYYEYVGMFLPDEGEFGLSSGMYINEGYGHFVFPSQDIDYAEPIAVHELTHACLVHLPIPLWLNEGVAVLMEDVLAGNRLFLDKEMVERHQRYWNENSIQDFSLNNVNGQNLRFKQCNSQKHKILLFWTCKSRSRTCILCPGLLFDVLDLYFVSRTCI